MIGQAELAARRDDDRSDTAEQRPSVAIFTGLGCTSLADAEMVARPGDLVGKDPLPMLIEFLDDLAGEIAGAHVGERLGVDDIVAMAGAEQLQEVLAALGKRGPEKRADLRGDAIPGAMERPCHRP